MILMACRDKHAYSYKLLEKDTQYILIPAYDEAFQNIYNQQF